MTAKTTTYIPSPGHIVSNATLRDEDLLSAFADELDRCGGDADLVEEARAWLLVYKHLDPMPERVSSLINEDLFDALNEYAPPFCCFGSQEGDGACFGFWFDSESFEESCRAGDVVKVDAGATWTVKQLAGCHSSSMQNMLLVGDDELMQCQGDFKYVAEISDHGNIRLCDREGNEIWSII